MLLNDLLGTFNSLLTKNNLLIMKRTFTLLLFSVFCLIGSINAQVVQSNSIEDLLSRLAEVSNTAGSISDYFTQTELQILKSHFVNQNNSNAQHRIIEGPQTGLTEINQNGANFASWAEINPEKVQQQNETVEALTINRILSGDNSHLFLEVVPIDGLLSRQAENGNVAGNISDYFTQNELQMHKVFYSSKEISTVESRIKNLENISAERTIGDCSISSPNPIMGTTVTNSSSQYVSTRGNNSVVTITHNLNENADLEILCTSVNTVADNMVWSEYDLDDDFGITADFVVTDVTISIRLGGTNGIPGPPEPTITVNIYSNDGVFPGGTQTLQGTANYTVTSADLDTIVTIPVAATIPFGANLLYEIVVPDHNPELGAFRFGVNDPATGVDSWILSNACGIAAPTTLTSIGFPSVFIMSVIGDEAGGGGGTPCSEMNPSNGFENAFTTSSDTPQIIGNDITVAADTNFTLETMTVNIMVDPGETVNSADITFYNDIAGIPDAGSIVNAQLGVVPTSQSVIGSAFGLDVVECIFDITPELLAGQAGVSTTYWTSLYVTISTGSGFIDSTTASIIGNDQAFSPDGGVTWLINGAWDTVYDFAGQCEPIGGGGGGDEWTVNVQGTGFGDEVSWELRDNTAAVILSGGPYGSGYNDTQMVTTSNEP